MAGIPSLVAYAYGWLGGLTAGYFYYAIRKSALAVLIR